MDEQLKEIDEIIDWLFSIRSQLLAESQVKETGGWTEEETEIVSKAYEEASRDYKFVA